MDKFVVNNYKQTFEVTGEELDSYLDEGHFEEVEPETEEEGAPEVYGVFSDGAVRLLVTYKLERSNMQKFDLLQHPVKVQFVAHDENGQRAQEATREQWFESLQEAEQWLEANGYDIIDDMWVDDKVQSGYYWTWISDEYDADIIFTDGVEVKIENVGMSQPNRVTVLFEGQEYNWDDVIS